MTRKAWENVGFASGGFAIAVLLLWAGAIGGGAFEHQLGTLALAVVLALVSGSVFLWLLRTRR